MKTLYKVTSYGSLLYLYSATGHQQVHEGVDGQQAPHDDSHIHIEHHGEQQVQEGRPQADGLQHQGQDDGKHQQTTPGVPEDKHIAVTRALAEQLHVLQSARGGTGIHVTKQKL
ncbi:hypothetical protein Bpfe_016028 [Biomphalaria pfeifferi]|uniref:Uncharacterized protein n=1 Tax=Biomphalaria pfeifferi TaxID=112525 RepID=A0AAD8F7E3_BIOPF|nr:hypothetical protein Bpfe_016028 [Biomphalaria pfeifferi]